MENTINKCLKSFLWSLKEEVKMNITFNRMKLQIKKHIRTFSYSGLNFQMNPFQIGEVEVRQFLKIVTSTDDHDEHVIDVIFYV